GDAKSSAAGGPAKSDKAAKDDKAPKPAVKVTIDFDGLSSRILAVPGVPEKPYALLKAGAAGAPHYNEQTPPPRGGGGGGGGAGLRGTLMRYKLSDRKAATFASEVADYAVSADGKKLVYRTPAPAEAGPAPNAQPTTPPNLFLVDADKTPPDAGKGKLQVSLSMWLDPQAEFAPIFHEGWRDERDYLYRPNMHPADWPKMKAWYGQFLPYVRHRADLNYLLDMMGAEIAIGHSYVRGGDMPDVPAVKGGLLGADFTVENGRYRIARIYDNESWNPELKAPLAVPGVNISVGDYVLAVNGEKLEAPDNLYRLLDGTAAKQTVLTVNTKPSLDG